MHRPLLPVLAALVACGTPVLEAQAVVRQTMGMTLTMNLERFLQSLARGRVGSLVVVDGEGRLREGLKALLNQDPLLEMGVPLQTLEPDKGMGKELRDRQTWSEVPRWAFLDAKGVVRLEGTELPGAANLADQLLASGFIDRTRELQSFLSKHPESVEALDQLLRHRFRIAGNRMRPFLKPPDPPKSQNPEDLASARMAPQELTRPLSDSEDRLIWGLCSETLEKLLRQDGWQLSLTDFMGFNSFGNVFPFEARFSPLMKAVCVRHLAKVEETLLRAPGNPAYWRIWVRLAGCAGRGNLRTLSQAVTTVPSRMRMPLPPDEVLPDYVLECRQAKDWKALQEAMVLRFEEARDRFKDAQYVQVMKQFRGGDLAAGTWDSALGPYLESLLMQGNTSAAEAVVNEALGWPGAKGLPAAAAAVATRCGHEDLAKRWASLNPTEK